MRSSVDIQNWEYNIEHISISGTVDGDKVAVVVKRRALEPLVVRYEADRAANWPALKVALAKELAKAKKVKPVIKTPDSIEVEV